MLPVSVVVAPDDAGSFRSYRIRPDSERCQVQVSFVIASRPGLGPASGSPAAACECHNESQETTMFIGVIHHIHDPEGFQAAEDKAIANGLPPYVKLPIHAATKDHRLGICIWEGESVGAVRELVESVVGQYSKNEYFEMHVDGLTPQLGK